MNILSICITCLLACCYCLGLDHVSVQDGEQTIVYSLAKDDSINFDGIFLMSSELNTAHENALGVLNKTCAIEDLKNSISKIETLGQKIPSIGSEDINNFVQTLHSLVEHVSDMNQQELQNIETSLNFLYNNIAQRLNNYISSH